MDEAITQYIKRKYNLLIGERTAEAIKIQLGSAFPLDEPLSMDVRGRNLIEGIPKTITITDEEVREALADSVATIVNAVRLGPCRSAAWSSTWLDPRSARTSPATRSSPSAERKRHAPASLASWTAATAPPPPAPSQVSVACSIAPGVGIRWTRAKRIHSMWPTTANRIAGP